MEFLKLKNREILVELAKGWGYEFTFELPVKQPNFFNNVGELSTINGFSEIIKHEIQSYVLRDKFEFEDLEEILISLAIDSEGVEVFQLLESNFRSRNLFDLIFIGLSHQWKEVRWQMMELIMKSEIQNKESLLYYSLKNEGDCYVIRVGLGILSFINIRLAKLIAKQHLKSKDSYLRILAMDIIEK